MDDKVPARPHPCFEGGCAADTARIHLAVAPRCNISCNYCVRKNDCVNESRPGVTSKVLDPDQALARFSAARERIDNLAVVGIAGPGDALANWPAVRRTLELIRAHDTQVAFCLSTNGLMLPAYADQLVAAGVSHVTVTMNTVDPRIGAQMYRQVVYEGRALSGVQGASVLLENQMAGIERLAFQGVRVKVNTVLVRGVNEGCIEDVAHLAARLGADCQNITGMIPVPGSVFQDVQPVDAAALADTRTQCGQSIRQILHCRQCRADAVGKLGQDLAALLETLPPLRARVAVASQSGVFVDAHFGQVERFLIYETDGTDVRLVDTRAVRAYCQGPLSCGSAERHRVLQGAMDAVADCRIVLASKIGPGPARELAARGLRTVQTVERIDDAVLDAFDALMPAVPTAADTAGKTVGTPVPVQ